MSNAALNITSNTLIVSRIGKVTHVACPDNNGNWIEKSGANIGLATKHLTTELRKRGMPIPSEWVVDDRTPTAPALDLVPVAPKAEKVDGPKTPLLTNFKPKAAKALAPKAHTTPVDDAGFIHPTAPQWRTMFEAAVTIVTAKSGIEDIPQFKKDVDALMRTTGATGGFEKLPNGNSALTLAGVKDPTIRPPQAGEGARRVLPGLNGFLRDSAGKAYFEEGAKVRATPMETFKQFRMEQGREAATTVEGVQALLASGIEKKDLHRSEKKILNKHLHAEARESAKKASAKQEYTKQVWDAGKALSKAAEAAQQNKTFWYKVGIVAMIRHTGQAPRVDFERTVVDGLTSAGYDANAFLAGDALAMIAEALAAK